MEKTKTNKIKTHKITGYMTFRDGEPLEISAIFQAGWSVYADEAPKYQKGDKSVKVEITYNN